MASMAFSSVECAVMTMTSVASLRSLAKPSTSKPDPSGMARSVSTKGKGCGLWRNASCAARAPGTASTS